MIVRKNPPSFILVDKSTGEVVYTKRATGVGSEAISGCVKRGHALAAKTGKTYFVYLDIMGAKIGMKISVPMAYAMGITEEVGPEGSAMPSGRKCCSSPDVQPSGQGMRCFNCQHWESDNYLKNPGRVRKNVFLFNNPPSGPADQTAARELELYIDNDADLYRQQFLPIVRNLMRRRQNGTYDSSKAVTLFMYLMDAGAKKYVTEFGTRGSKIDSMFNRNTRLQAARAFRDSFETEAGLGNYDKFAPPGKRGVWKRPLQNPTRGERLVKLIRCVCGRTMATADADSSGTIQCDCGKLYNSFGQRLKSETEMRRRDWDDELDNPGKVRKNVFLFNNPGQIAIYEVFVGNVGRVYFGDSRDRAVRTYEQYVNYSQRGIGSAAGEDVTMITEGELSREHIGSNSRRGGSWRSSDTRNNPRKLNAMESAAASVGLLVTTWAPGDGVTRFRFFKKTGSERYADYNQGGAIYTAHGRGDAMKFIESYGMGRSRKNPLTRAEAGQELKFARETMKYAADKQRSGKDASSEFGYAQGIAGVVGRRSTRRGAQVAERVIRHVRYNPVCSNPIIRGDKLPQRLQDEALRRYIYRWTTGNDRRGEVYGMCPHCKSRGGKPSETNIACRQVHPTIPLITDAEWLATHAFHITKDGRFSEKHNHAEPGYMADEERARPNSYGNILPNPLLQTIMLTNPGSVKTFNEMQDVGKSKYVVNYHDGVKVHRDGSPFFDIAIFSSRDKKDRFVRKLESLGFTRGSFRNPPISAQWDKMTTRQRIAVMNAAGYAGDYVVNRSWNQLDKSMKHNIESIWLDTSAHGGTTRRRSRVANPLTRRESSGIIREAKRDIRYGSGFRAGDFTRTVSAGQAFGKSKVVRKYGPKSAGRAAVKIADKAHKMVGTIFSNPGSLRLPKPGTKLTVAQALELARRIGDRGLIQQCQKALKLQKSANKDAKCVIWKTFPMGSPDKIDSVVALTHYGDSPETMYQPPKGSKKGNHMYRHKWGEGGGGKKTVPLLASADGKMLLMPLEGKKIASDWLRH